MKSKNEKNTNTMTNTNKNRKAKEAKWYDLNEDEKRKFFDFIRTSFEKDATFRGAFKSIRDALNNRSLTIMLYTPELGMNVLCRGGELLELMSDMEKERPLVDDANNHRTKVGVGMPWGFRVTPDPANMVRESNKWFLELTARRCARWIAKKFSSDDVVAVGLEVGEDSSIQIHVAYKCEVEDYEGLEYLPITSSFLTSMMGVAA